MTHPDEQAEQIMREIEEDVLSEERLSKLKAAIAHDEKYPECAKLSANHTKILELQRFLDWCEEENKPMILLTSAVDFQEKEYTGRLRELLIYRYFEIDPVKLEKERRAMLDEQRKLNERK